MFTEGGGEDKDFDVIYIPLDTIEVDGDFHSRNVGIIINKLSGVQSREESPLGDKIEIWQSCNTKCGNPVDYTV